MGGARSMWRWLDGANRPWLPEHGGWMDLPLQEALVAGTWRMDGRATTHGRSIIVGGHGLYATKEKEEAT